jgi:predicted metal-binding membrane protein
MTTVGLRRSTWRHPEAAAAGVAALAWVGLVAAVAGPAPVRALHDHAHAAVPLVADTAGFAAMTVAMMVPGALPVARVHALGALWARRQRTVTIFFATYLLLWTALGLVATVAVRALEHGLGLSSELLLAATLVVASGWELAPAKWRSVRACHLVTPLPPRGASADRACARAGAVYAGRCVTACWAVMLAMVVAGHAALGLMVLLATVISAEKLLDRSARFAEPLAAMLAFAAVITLAIGGGTT